MSAHDLEQNYDSGSELAFINREPIETLKAEIRHLFKETQNDPPQHAALVLAAVQAMREAKIEWRQWKTIEDTLASKPPPLTQENLQRFLLTVQPRTQQRGSDEPKWDPIPSEIEEAVRNLDLNATEDKGKRQEDGKNDDKDSE